jgi:hypothetical protein
MYIYTVLLRMTYTVTSQNIDLCPWYILCRLKSLDNSEGIEKDLEASGRGLLQGIIPAFAWRD